MKGFLQRREPLAEDKDTTSEYPPGGECTRGGVLSGSIWRTQVAVSEKSIVMPEIHMTNVTREDRSHRLHSSD